jgi:U2-associated protein SR140
VRGGVINPNDRSKPVSESVPRGGSSKESTPASTKKPGSRYVPSFIPPGLAAMVNKEKEPEKRRDDEKNRDRERGKPRNIDHFMEELKREQEAREKRTADREQRRSDRKSQVTGMVAFRTWCDDASKYRNQFLSRGSLDIKSFKHMHFQYVVIE